MGEGLLSPYEVEEHQSVEIDDFFYNNICNNYFKLYDYATINDTSSRIND